MTPEIPKGWEKCTVLCATKVMLATGDNLFNFENLGSSIRLTSGSSIRIADMDWLGITPVRKVQVEPIEFTVKGWQLLQDGFWVKVPFDRDMIGKTFREVTD